jgi:hypothetical protein
MPTSAVARAGASLMPIADHHHRRAPRVALHTLDDLQLVLRALLRVDAIQAERPTDSLGDLLAVSAEHRHLAHAGDAQPSDQLVGVGANVVAHHEGASEVPVNAHEHHRVALG